jgi:hypothetical protein
MSNATSLLQKLTEPSGHRHCKCGVKLSSRPEPKCRQTYYVLNFATWHSRLEHSSDVVGQSGRHTDELRPCAEKGAGAVAVERLDVNGPVPTGANDLSQALCVVLIRLVDLHLEGGTRMPGIKTHNFEAEIAEFMHEPWRHRSSFDSYVGVIPRIATHQSADLFWICGALAPP